MPAKPNDDLAAFIYWLEDTRGIGRRSATVYASRVRAVLNMTQSPVNQENLDAFMKSAWAERSRDGYYAAWNRFVEYGASKNVKLASPTLRSEARKARKKYDVPATILSHLLELIATGQFNVKLVPEIKWKHFRKIPQNGMWQMDDPTARGYFYNVPLSLVTAIYEWGHPERPAPESPLIPIVCGSAEPMPIIPLRRILARHRNNR